MKQWHRVLVIVLIYSCSLWQWHDYDYYC